MARVALLGLLLAALAGCGGGGGSKTSLPMPSWPAPPNPMELTRKAGLVPERAEFLQYHVHAHLDVFVNGDSVTVPAGIGINIEDPAVEGDRDSGYGLSRECAQPCISPLHTHAADGILHTETRTPQPNTLGQFFTEWNVALRPGGIGPYYKVRMYVDGEAFDGDPREIELSDGREIAIVVGPAPDPIPSKFPQ